MDKDSIKKLANATIENGIIQQEIASYVLEKLSKSELKQYLFFLKQVINNSTVVVKSAEEIDNETKKTLIKLFGGKTLEYEIDETLGAGLFIKTEDLVFDGTIKGALKSTAQKLKQIV